MAYQTSTNLYTNTKYVVSSAGNTPYTTIQSAINAANTAGIPAIIYIRPGTYTENLTLYSQIDLEGSESTEVVISGLHTPPNSGSLSFTRIGFTSATSVISSAAAGTTTIKFTRCNFNITNGYVCNVASWTGAITFKYCDEGSSTNNGVINNAGASTITVKNSSLGTGTGNSLTSNGSLLFNNADIGCPITLSGSAVSVIQGGSTLRGTVTASANADLQISNSRMPTGTAIGLVASSTVAVKLSNVVIDSTNTYAVSGTTTYKPNEVTFPNSKGINPTVTEILTGVVKTGEIFADTVTRMNMTGFYSWSGAAPYFDDTTLGSFTITAAGAGTGYIKGRLITWTGPQTVAGMTSGSTWFIYIDSTGTIGKTNVHTDALYEDYIVLFECLYDETSGTKIQYTVRENHPYSFQTGPSNYLHDIVGPVIENVNNGANITLVGPANVKIAISGDDYLSDHGITTTISDSGGAGVTWNKMYTTAAGKWARDGAASDTFLGRYNNAGTPTNLGGSKFGVYTLYVTKDDITTSTPKYFAVLDTTQYNTSGAASTAIANGTTARAAGELALLEMAQLGYIIFSQSAGAITTVTISKATLKQTLSTGGMNTAALVTTSVTNFNNLLSSSDTNVQSALDTLDDIFVNTTLATTSPQVYFKKYRGAAALTSGDLTGTVKFGGYDGTQVTDSARITSTSSGTIASTRVAGDLKFYTHPDSAAADPTLRMTIAPTGGVTIASPTAGTALTITAGGLTVTAGDLTVSAGTIESTVPTNNYIMTLNSARFISVTGSRSVYVGQASGPATANIDDNCSLGEGTLSSITAGSGRNVAIGADTMKQTTNNAGSNTAVGYSCIYSASFSGSYNTCVGEQALYSLTSGTFNCALGEGSGYRLTTGTQNCLLGSGDASHGAGYNYTSSESSNIIIGNLGTTAESNCIRIGTQGNGAAQQQDAWMAGIYTMGSALGGTAKAVLVDSTGKIGGLAGSTGQFLMGGTTPTFQAITGLVKVNATADGTAAVNTSYTINHATPANLLTLTLPATYAVGDRVEIVGNTAGMWKLVAASGDTIKVAGSTTSSGGYLSATTQYDCVEVVCTIADTTWVASSVVGNLTIA